MNNLLVLSPKAEKYVSLLKDRKLPDLNIFAATDSEGGRQFISECNIILGVPMSVAGILSDARRLVWVQSTYAGIESLCAPGLRTDYALTGVKGVFGPLMSEYVFTYILALERHIFEIRQNQAASAWKDIPYRSLNGLKLGICGLGSIGRHIARNATRFGMRVWGFKHAFDEVPDVERVYTPPAFYDFLAVPDYLVITLPLTTETKHLFNRDALKHMKPSAVLINIGRGPIVCEDDLVDALTDGAIRGAVLDVFEEEPLPPSSPLWDTPNAIITPHNAGVSYPEDIVEIFCDNYQRFMENRPLKFAVDFAKGY